jgi:hypothetical protein
MNANDAGQKSLIKSIEQALTIDATNAQIGVSAQLLNGLTELLISKGILSKAEVLTMVEAKRKNLVSRYTQNKTRFEMIDGLDIYESTVAETNTAFDQYRDNVEKI